MDVVWQWQKDQWRQQWADSNPLKKMKVDNQVKVSCDIRENGGCYYSIVRRHDLYLELLEVEHQKLPCQTYLTYTSIEEDERRIGCRDLWTICCKNERLTDFERRKRKVVGRGVSCMSQLACWSPLHSTIVSSIETKKSPGLIPEACPSLDLTINRWSWDIVYGDYILHTPMGGGWWWVH